MPAPFVYKNIIVANFPLFYLRMSKKISNFAPEF